MEVEGDSMQATQSDEIRGYNSCLNKEEENIVPISRQKIDFDQWPVTKQLRHHHLANLRPSEVEKLVQKLNQARYAIMDKLEGKKWDRDHIISHLKWSSYGYGDTYLINRKKKEIEYLQQALRELCCWKSSSRRTAIRVCSPAADLNKKIKSLQYRIKHGSKNLTEEKQFLRGIKEAETEREKLSPNDSVKPIIRDYRGFQNAPGSKAAIEHRIQLISNDLQRLEEEKLAFITKMKHLKRDLETVKKNITSLQKKLEQIGRNKTKAYAYLLEIKKQCTV